MLPNPSITTTIPSIHDDTVLDCRIYSPTKYLHNLLKTGTPQCPKKAAIVAHPYAPLGGDYDDPVVGVVGTELLKEGFWVATFNFRGAGGSKGRTSWTAKPETEDYLSVVGLMVYFMHYLRIPLNALEEEGGAYALSPIPSQALPPTTSLVLPGGHRFSPANPSDTNGVCDGPAEESLVSTGQDTLLLMAGYSYGSMITTQLPPLYTIIDTFNTASPGTAASEIRLRAKELAKQQNEILSTMASSLPQERALASPNLHNPKHRGRSLQPGAVAGRQSTSVSSAVRIGGEETDPSIRRASHDSPSRRSFSLETERLRRSVDRVRSLGRSPLSPSRDSVKPAHMPSISRSNGSSSSEKDKDENREPKMEHVSLDSIRPAYLLISPLAGAVAKLATMSLKSFTSHKSELYPPPEEGKLSTNPTFAIFGDEDGFSNKKNLMRWAASLNNRQDSKFDYVVVEGAGHFWHDGRHVEELKRGIRGFVKGP
jgi:alpha/beta superfamily hydrolase